MPGSTTTAPPATASTSRPCSHARRRARPARRRAVPVPGQQRVGARRAQPHRHQGLLGAGHEDDTRTEPFVYDADHPTVLVGTGKGPTPVEFLLHAIAACLTAGVRQRRVGARHHPAPGRVDRRGRHRPARHLRDVRPGAQRLPRDPGALHDRRRRLARAAAAPSSSSRAAGPPSTTCSPTAPAWRSTSRPPDRRRPEVAPTSGRRPTPSAVRGFAVRMSHFKEPVMPAFPVVVIGAGPAGLAVSHELGLRGVDHVVLDRGRSAETWRSRRWDSLRLLSPAWATRLPGLPPAADPDAFLVGDRARHPPRPLRRLLLGPGRRARERALRARVRRPLPRRQHRRQLDRHAVVLATGDAAAPAVPALASGMPSHLHQLASDAYRRPAQLPEGGVLVVGASASGVQLADELAAAGRDVVLAVGRHTRMVRSHRGVDVYRWMERLGSLDRPLGPGLGPGRARCASRRCSSRATPEQRGRARPEPGRPRRPVASGSRGG